MKEHKYYHDLTEDEKNDLTILWKRLDSFGFDRLLKTIINIYSTQLLQLEYPVDDWFIYYYKERGPPFVREIGKGVQLNKDWIVINDTIEKNYFRILFFEDPIATKPTNNSISHLTNKLTEPKKYQDFTEQEITDFDTFLDRLKTYAFDQFLKRNAPIYSSKIDVTQCGGMGQPTFKDWMIYHFSNSGFSFLREVGFLSELYKKEYQVIYNYIKNSNFSILFFET